MPTYTAATNPAYYDGMAQGWTVQSTQSEGGGDQSLVSAGSAPTTGFGGGGPAMWGLTAYDFSPNMAIAGTVNLATGVQYASKFYWPGGNMNYLWAWVSTAATTTTHGWFAVYDTTGTLWASTADQTTTWLGTLGVSKVAAVGAPVPVPSGYYYGYTAGVFSATAPKVAGLSGAIGTPTLIAGEVNINTAGSWNFATDLTTVSALPASLAWGTGWAADGGSTGVAMWFAVS